MRGNGWSEWSNAMAATIVTEAPVQAPVPAAKPWYRVLYVQVLIAIVLGALMGWRALPPMSGSRRLATASSS